MRRTFWLLVLAGCAGPDSDPVDVAERFHALRMAGDEHGIHALLAEPDRVAVPVELFPTGLPAGAARALLGQTHALSAAASLLSTRGDTAAVLLPLADGGQDTVRLVATHDPLRLLGFERSRVRWRVSVGLAERMSLDSLAALVRADASATDPAAVERAEAYLRAAERHPALARPADVAAAGSLLRTAAVAEALGIELRMTESLRGVSFLEGQLRNPTATRIATLRLIVRDAAGSEERLELWDVAPESSAAVRQLTRLRRPPLTHRVERIQVY